MFTGMMTIYLTLRPLAGLLGKRLQRGATAMEMALLVMFVAALISRWPAFLMKPTQKLATFLLECALPQYSN